VGQHDFSYRLFFAHRRMIQDLLREIVGEQWVERIDLGSGERVDASFVSPKHENRESDVIWQFRRKDGGEPVYVYILLEFQSRPDPSMPVRLMGYESLFYQLLMAGQPAAGWRKLPLVIPVVVYNGWEPWNVAMDLGSLIGELDPSAEIYRPQLRYRLVDEARYPREDLAALNSPVADLFRIERKAATGWRSDRASTDCGRASRRARPPCGRLSRPGCGSSSCRASDCPRRKPPPLPRWRRLKPCWLRASTAGTVSFARKLSRRGVRRGKLGCCFACFA
jgi:hypothetical protein